MGATWNTKYGGRRVRHDPPTLAEAMTAASGLTDEIDQQIEIAASLMGVGTDEVRVLAEEMLRAQNAARAPRTITRTGQTRTVIVEKKPVRRMLNAPVRAKPTGGSGS